MIISVIARKGGVGKTVTASNLAVALAASGRVLAVDADAQGHLAAVLGVDLNADSERRFAHMLLDVTSQGSVNRAADLALRSMPAGPRLALIPGDEITRDAERAIQTRRALLDAVGGFRAAVAAAGYDYTVIDSGPRGALQDWAAAVADVVIVVARCDFLGASAAFDALALVGEIGKLTGRDIPAWVLPTMYNGRERDSRQWLGELSAQVGGDRMLPYIPLRVAVPGSISAGVPVVKYAPDSEAALAYLQAVDVITGRVGEYVEGGK